MGGKWCYHSNLLKSLELKKKRRKKRSATFFFYKNIGTYLPTLWNSSRHIFLTGDIKINYITNLKRKNIPAQFLKGLYPFPLDKHLFNYNYFCQLVVRIHQRHTMSFQEYDKKHFEQRLCIVFQHFAYLLKQTFLHTIVWFAVFIIW